MFSIPLFRTSKLQQFFTYKGVEIWNSILHNIADLSYKKFKASYKLYLLVKPQSQDFYFQITIKHMTVCLTLQRIIVKHIAYK